MQNTLTSTVESIKVFISYRNMEPSSSSARILDDRLSTEGFETFFDTDELRGGDRWTEKIYRNISDSDVLIVLLQPETIESVWVQREVDFARGAQIRILPLVVTSEQFDPTSVLDKLAIRETQFLLFDPKLADMTKISQAILEQSKRTRDTQKIWIKSLEEKRRERPADNNLSVASYSADGRAFPCEIHLASGDMIAAKNIDVLVNSMNDYMQMAQFYETKTLSSSLRIAGAYRQRGGRIIDSVQQQLNDQLVDIGLPVEMHEVIVTPAGHPQGKLIQRNGNRYIFHVATSQVNIKTFKEKLTPIDDDDGIMEVVNSCLDRVREVNAAKGVISMPGSPGYEQEVAQADAFQPIRSIIFPIFGTGRGGRSVIEVTPPMIRAINNFLVSNRDDENLHLERIHICIYQQAGLRRVKDIMDQYLIPNP